MVGKEEAFVHLISFQSVIQPRVVNSTIKAETYQLSAVVESADVLRAAIADWPGSLRPAEVCCSRRCSSTSKEDALRSEARSLGVVSKQGDRPRLEARTAKIGAC